MSSFRVSFSDMKAEVVREIAMRKKVYPAMIQSGKIKSKKEAERRVATLEGLLQMLERYDANQAGFQTTTPDGNGKYYYFPHAMFEDKVIEVGL